MHDCLRVVFPIRQCAPTLVTTSRTRGVELFLVPGLERPDSFPWEGNIADLMIDSQETPYTGGEAGIRIDIRLTVPQTQVPGVRRRCIGVRSSPESA